MNQDFIKTKKGTYKLLELLGAGTGGQVFKALNQRDQTLVAVKKQLSLSDAERDAIILLEQRKLQHITNILDFDMSEGHYIIVMELGAGSFFDLIKYGVDQLNLDDRINYIQQVAKGVEELHKIGLIHRDLKPENVVFVMVGNQRILKLCDTGLMRDKNAMRKTQRIGTPYYMPPEQINSQTYTDKVDIWALGQMLFELINGQPLFNGNNLDQILNNIVQAKQQYINNRIDSLVCPQNIKDLLKKMIVVISWQRLTATQIVSALNHEQQKIIPPVPGNNNLGPLPQPPQPIKPPANKQIIEELQREEQKKKEEELLKQIQIQKEEELKRLQEQNEKEMNEKLKQYQQQLLEEKNQQIQLEVIEVKKALDEQNQKILAAKEREINEQGKKLEQQYQQLQHQDLQKFNQEKVLLEVKKQNEIQKFKQEQQEILEQQILQKELEIKKQKDLELQLKLNNWKQQYQKEVEEQIHNKFQRMYEEQARKIKLQQQQEQQQMMLQKKDTLKSQMICVNVFVQSQIEFMNQKKGEIQTNYDSQLTNVQTIIQQIDQNLLLLQNQKDFIQNELNLIDLLTTDQVNNLIKEYEARLQVIKEQNQQQIQAITDIYSQIKQQQIETEQQRKDQEIQLLNLKNQMIEKQKQSEQMQSANQISIQIWDKTLKDCSFASTEMKQQLEQIQETDQISKAQMFQIAQFQLIQSNDVKDHIKQVQTQIKVLENVIVASNQIQQKLTYLSNYYMQQKKNYLNTLQQQKSNLLNQCQCYLEQSRSIYQYQQQLFFESVKQIYNQIIQDIDQLDSLQSQIERLEFQPEIDDLKIAFNEKQLEYYSMEVEKKNYQIIDLKKKFQEAFQEQKESMIVQDKCKITFNQLLAKSNMKEAFTDIQNCLKKIQESAKQLYNKELDQQISQKFINIQKEESDSAILQVQLQTSLLGGTIKTENQFQRIVTDFNIKIEKVRNNTDKEKQSMKELEYLVQQSLTKYKTEMDQKVSEIAHTIESVLTEKILVHQKNIEYMGNLDQLKQFEVLKDGGLNKEIEELRNKAKSYKECFEEIERDIQILEREQNQQTQWNSDKLFNKKEKLTRISDQMFQYYKKLKSELENCEKQLKDLKYYNDFDVEKLQLKLSQHIKQEESQQNLYKQKLEEIKSLVKQYQMELNSSEIFEKLKAQESLYKSSMIYSMQINYFDEWQSQIDRLFPIKQQFQLCRCYILQSKLFDLERLCQRRMNNLQMKQNQENQTQAKQNQEGKRKTDLEDIQLTMKSIEENKSFLIKQSNFLNTNENVDLDLTQQFTSVEKQIIQYQTNIENEIKQRNLVKLRSVIKNQDLIKVIQQRFTNRLESNRMQMYEYLQTPDLAQIIKQTLVEIERAKLNQEEKQKLVY